MPPRTVAFDESPSDAPKGRRQLPRFGLRSLLVYATLFCLLLAWIGRGFYRVRQEDAAIETILRSGGSLYTGIDRGLYGAPGALSEPSALPLFERCGDLFFRSVGWRQRPAVATVELRILDANDPAADEATAALALLPEVRSVLLMGPSFDDDSLQALDRLPQLENLYLVRTSATANGLAKIAAPERLKYLHVQEQGTNLLKGSVALRELREADVINSAISREDVAALASLPRLETLDFSDVQLAGDETLTPLAEAKNLRSLKLHVADGTLDADELKAVATAPGLERLATYLDEADLPLFAGAEKLRFLRPFLPISEEAAQDFSLERPECVIEVPRSLGPSLYLKNGERVERPASEANRY